MKFELVFNKEIYNQQMNLLFDLAWKRKILYYKNSQYLGSILIFIGVIMIFNRPSLFGFVLIVFGLSILIPFVYYYFKIKSDYKKIDLAKIKESEINEDLKDFIFEFTERSFIMNAGKHSISIDWEEFLMYLVKENNLILITKDYQPYILGEIEVGRVNFQKIILFVKEKIKIE
jgi:predicted membrane protein